MSKGRGFVWLGAHPPRFGQGGGWQGFATVRHFRGSVNSRGVGIWGGSSEAVGKHTASDDNDSNPMRWEPEVRRWPSKGANW
jgi:hypothetical protein